MLTGRENERRGTSVWCAGLPLVDERRLDREEQERLRRAAWHLLWRGLGSFLAALLLGVLAMALTSVLGGAWSGTLLIIVILFVSLLLFLPATLFARECWTQRGLLLFRDLRRGYVRVFAGLLTVADLLQTEDAADAAQGRLVALGLLTLEEAHPQTVEVLPVSRRVWRVSGEEVSPWVEALWREVSTAPDAASPWLHTNGPAVEGGTGRRPLSDRERAELLREARQHWLRPFVPALLLTCWLVVVLVFGAMTAIAAGRVTWSSGLWSAFHLAWITFATDAFFLRRWTQSRQMYQDARGGVVSFETGPTGGSNSATVSETLPHSGRAWTQAGRPAAWRRIGR